MGKKAYNHSKESDRAKTLQHINDLINKNCRDSIDSDDDIDSGAIGCVADSNGNISDEVQELSREKRKRDEYYDDFNNNEYNIIHKNKKLCSDEQLQ